MRQISNSDEDNSYCQLAYRIMIHRVGRADKMRKTAIKKTLQKRSAFEISQRQFRLSNIDSRWIEFMDVIVNRINSFLVCRWYYILYT